MGKYIRWEIAIMGAKIAITGKRVSPIITTKDYHRFEILAGGSPSAPKGLPLASSVLYSIFVGLKQGRAIEILKLPDNQLFLIAGEIILGLSKKTCPGQIGVISFNTKLVEGKTPVANEEPPNASVQEAKGVVYNLNTLPALKKHDSIFPEFKEEVHLKFNGRCVLCSAKMDKTVARIKLIDSNKPANLENMSLLCPDCIKDRPNPALSGFSVAPKAVLKFESLGMDETARVQFLSDFINKFVLVDIVESMNLREYWVPGKQPIFKFKVVNNVITDMRIIKKLIPESS